ncbi:diaminobutyrate acetyltransferase [Limnobacter litoralis]|uniref:L-2,4-diaminobutyric acid acetyltransferase n=1 Tax=Limnobacter litoralis TaxID=481366 RepID=A0ABQ5YUC0_9BURK|nr:diaminobutyrate acetyltransferase [Limnobacter litoralis]GLR27642.1 L-2,4-diaminobutyric acid acetyltransferase [Limnobacter litoralis]
MSMQNLVLRQPVLADATAVFDLVSECKPLDLNSHYLYLLQCSHFADTCVLAELDGQLVGWVSAYCPPGMPDVLFVWQVAVGPTARGSGLARKMIQALIDKTPSARQLHTSITPDNKASWALFEGLSRRWNATLTQADWFEKHAHFGGRHDTEVLVRIALPATLP